MKRAACVLLRNSELILSVARRDNPFDMGLPGGKANDGESSRDCAIREFHEEVLGARVLLRSPIYVAQCGDFMVTTFEAWPLPVESNWRLRAGDGGAVAWVPWSELLSDRASFRDYNRGLCMACGGY